MRTSQPLLLAPLALFALSVGACVHPAPEAAAPPRALAPLPSPRQQAWSELELYAFCHFGMDTFTDAEWGSGQEDPALFAPSELDARQWCRALAEAGFRGLILVAKHHDGFCLWPSAQTTHTVAASPWRGGQGDLVREVSDAAREHGLEFGVYLSPWDRHEPSYGDSPRYNQHFLAQLREVLSGYGEIFEVWFDGACGEGPNGKRQEYDFEAYTALVRELQPGACIFSDVGPDVRWVGNEAGFAGETNWSLLSPAGYQPGALAPPTEELNRGRRDGTHWIQAECDVSIRPGWFHHAAQDDEVKSLEQLLEVYYASVGRNAALLLNVPADRRGLLHENDVARLAEFGHALRQTFAHDLARGALARASSVHGSSRGAWGPAALVDGSAQTSWAAAEGQSQATLELELESEAWLDHVVLREPIALGQRVESFVVQARVGEGPDAWRELARGTTIGRKRILRFPSLATRGLRVVIEAARAAPALASIEAYCGPPSVHVLTPERSFLGSLSVGLAATRPTAEIRYTLDGQAPTRASELYRGPLRLAQSGTLRARAFEGPREGLLEARAEFRAWRPDELLPATVFVQAPAPGLAWAAYEEGWQELARLEQSRPRARGTSAGFETQHATRAEQVALEFQGVVDVPRDGIYAFATESDDGSRLWIDERALVDNDGRHGLQKRSGEIALRAGWHRLRVAWNNAGGPGALKVTWRGPGIAEGELPAAALAH